VSYFCNILKHPFLRVKSEFELYNCICRYIASQDNLTQKNITDLMNNIRFRWMPIDEIHLCAKDEKVPKETLLEAILMRLATYEKSNEKFYADDQRFHKRITCNTFEYKGANFDENGVIFYLSTNGGTEQYKNPQLTGKIFVTFSSIEVGSSADFLNKTPSELWTKDVPASWFMIDFGENTTVAPTHYTLRHGGNYRSDSLRTWNIQGSKDGKNWVVLRSHNQDQSLTDKFATNTWPVKVLDPGDLGFRYFRILQTGRNSSNHNFLVICGIEFFGHLYSSTKVDVQILNQVKSELNHSSPTNSFSASSSTSSFNS